MSPKQFFSAECHGLIMDWLFEDYGHLQGWQNHQELGDDFSLRHSSPILELCKISKTSLTIL